MRISALRITVTGFPRLADGSLTIGVLAAVQLESIISNLSSSIQVSTSAAACHWHAGLGRVVFDLRRHGGEFGRARNDHHIELERHARAPERPNARPRVLPAAAALPLHRHKPPGVDARLVNVRPERPGAQRLCAIRAFRRVRARRW